MKDKAFEVYAYEHIGRLTLAFILLITDFSLSKINNYNTILNWSIAILFAIIINFAIGLIIVLNKRKDFIHDEKNKKISKI